jgi:hypothetical protein
MSMVRCVCFQYSNWLADMYTSIGVARPTSISPRRKSPGPVRNMPIG